MKAETIERLVVTEKSEVNITATTFCSCWCGEIEEVAG